MKILHLIPSLAKGGAEKMVLDICEELSRRASVEVQLIVLSDLNTFDLDNYLFPIHLIPSSFRFALLGKSELNNQKLEEAITSFSPDVIHTHLFDAELIARLNISKNCVYFSHAHWNTKELKKPRYNFWLTKQGWIDWLVYRKMIKTYKVCNNHFITISQDTDAFYKENLPQFREKIHLLWNAIDTKAYNGNKQQGEKMKVISIGSLNSRKNQLFQLDIAKVLLQRNVDFQWTIIGDGPDKSQLQNMIKLNELNDHVMLYGISNEIPKLLHQHNLFVHTAIYEPFGLVIIEAMCAGLPVITLNGGGNCELIEQDKNGFIFNEEDPNLFANKLIELNEDKILYEKVANEGMNTAKKYDIRPYIDQLLKLYKKAK